MAKSSTVWQEAVDRFKAEAGPLSAVYVAENVNAMRVVAVWGYQVIAVHPQTRPPAEPNNRWRWAWDSVSLDMDALAAASGVHAKTCRGVVDALIGTRAIFPDGSVSQYAEQTVKAHLAQVITAKKHGRGK